MNAVDFQEANGTTALGNPVYRAPLYNVMRLRLTPEEIKQINETGHLWQVVHHDGRPECLEALKSVQSGLFTFPEFPQNPQRK